MLIAGTGHRPDKLVIGAENAYVRDVYLRVVDLAVAALEGVTEVVTGMAQGWDQALAEAALLRGIPFHAYAPFAGQERKWPAAAQRRYHKLLERAASVQVLSSPPASNVEAVAALYARNRAMVDTAKKAEGSVYALWNGESGGTGHCVKYAQERGVTMRNFWHSWERYKG